MNTGRSQIYVKSIFKKFIEKKNQTCGYQRQRVGGGRIGGRWSKGTEFHEEGE